MSMATNGLFFDRKRHWQDHVVCAFCVGKGGGGETNFPEIKRAQTPPGDTEQNAQIM